MRVLKPLVCLLALSASVATADTAPDWAYIKASPKEMRPPPPDWDEVRQVPGSDQTYTRGEIKDLFNAPIWFPDEVPQPIPRVVAHGAPPDVRACASCHLTSGQGHPESSHLSGLTAEYIMRQLQDFKSGARKDPVWMSEMAAALTEEDMQAAADWFAQIEPIPWVRVVETEEIPRSYFSKSRKRIPLDDGSMEPLGDAIAEFPEDVARVNDRDPNSGFVAYVPPGSVAKGEDLATTGGEGKTIACNACHGSDLRGQGDAPRIAGISPIYAVRQMYGFKNGDRTGSYASQMSIVMENLSQPEITAIAAYIASLDAVD